MKISVIVPVYNAEKYLKRCLNSLLNQGLTEGEIEVLCVDDGSTDGSGLILEEYAEMFPTVIRIFSQTHVGQAEARNLGLEQARGEVVTFCDADDYLVPNGLGYVLQTFWHEGLDVLCHASTTLDAYRLKHWQEDNEVKGYVVKEGSGREIYESDPKYFVWNTLISRSYIDKIGLRFQPLTMTEDSCFMLEAMMGAKNAVDVSSNIYRYTVNDTQVTRRRDSELMRRSMEGYLVLLSMLRYYGLNGVVATQRIPFYSRVLSAQLDRTEYQHLVEVVRGLDLYAPPFWLYVLLSVLHRKLIVPYILPRLRRG